MRIAMAKAADGMGTSDCHGLTALMLVRMARARRVLELGTCQGDSALFLLLGVASLDGERWLHSVDAMNIAFTPPRHLHQFWRFTVSRLSALWAQRARSHLCLCDRFARGR